ALVAGADQSGPDGLVPFPLVVAEVHRGRHRDDRPGREAGLEQISTVRFLPLGGCGGPGAGYHRVHLTAAGEVAGGLFEVRLTGGLLFGGEVECHVRSQLRWEVAFYCRRLEASLEFPIADFRFVIERPADRSRAFDRKSKIGNLKSTIPC